MAEELKACPFCSCTDIGEVTINLILEQRHRRFKVYCKACQCRTSEHKTRKEARIYWNTRAQPPSQGGETVAAWMLADAVGGSMLEFQRDLLLENQCRYGGEIVPLYTHPADQVADDLTMVKVSRELLQDMRDLAFDQVEHHRAAMGAYKQTRQSAMDSVLAQADALLEMKP